jgi:hypothetical protein
VKRAITVALLCASVLSPIAVRAATSGTSNAVAAPASSRGTTTTTTAPPSGTVDEAEWTLSAQLADGAIAHYTDRREVWPYLANFAAMGLARAAEMTGNGRYSNAAWRWLSWYQAHQDDNGYVTDYVVASDGSVASKHDMDSTDAYAGTFLLASRRTWLATGDRGRLTALAPGIRGAVRAITSTQDADGLTWAKPTWKVKYLMDQAEAYAGLQAAVELGRALSDNGVVTTASSAAQRMASGVSGLWNQSKGAYDWAVHDTGARQSTAWSTFYPDAQQQMWAVAFGLVGGSRARDLVGRFEASHPRWDQPASTEAFGTASQKVGYWPVTGWAYARAGQRSRAAVGANNIRSGANAAARAWPFTTASAGQLVTLASTDTRYAP